MNPHQQIIGPLMEVFVFCPCGLLANVAMDQRKPSEAASSSLTDLAFERHYSIAEIVDLWGLSEKTVRRIFGTEEGVLEWGHDEQRFRRSYKTLRIPESVVQRVHRRMRKIR
jgi:AraC-like DNA-binding protein